MKTLTCIVTILVLLCSVASCTQKQKNDEIIETKDSPKMNIETLASSLEAGSCNRIQQNPA